LAGIAWASRNTETMNAILARAGCEALRYRVGNLDYTVPAGAFFQVNRWLLESFRDLVIGQERGKLAWDLFAGVGFFARALESQFEHVAAVEGADASFASLAAALDQPNSQAVHSSTLAFLENNRLLREPRPDFIVLDPPRAGLDAKTCSLLAAIHAPRMTYVSCDPITLARDLKLLTAERFQIASIHLVDLFPQTFHCESVVKLIQKKAP
jgi:23S rRNA (uracil1939-C5)-methyltransferase